MKKIVSLALTLTLLLSLTPNAFATESGLSNFKKTHTYTDGLFPDVSSSSWYAENVQTAYELGLMIGTGSNFNPTGSLTIAEALTLACRLHSIFCGGTGNFEQGNPWYQVYIDYAVENGIITLGQYDYSATATRMDFANILYASFPATALQPINSVPDGTIPDVASSKAVYDLYRAGVLTGNDAYGTFYPNSSIERCAVAAIVTRMAATSLRKTFTLQKKPVPVSSVTVSSSSSVFVGKTITATATVLPTDATNKDITWSSSNTAVATVSNGVITGVSVGSATITATTNNGISESIKITVEKKESVCIYATNAKLHDSAGGVNPKIFWKNESGKSIKYITFTVTPYNKVGDQVYSEIGHTSTIDLRETGPILTFNKDYLVNPSSYSGDERWEYRYYKFFYQGYPYSINSFGQPQVFYNTGYSAGTYYLSDDDYALVFRESKWERIWYNGTISSMRISKVYIEYMDGTTETIDNPKIISNLYQP